MELERPAQLRTPAAEENGASGAGPLRPAFPVNAVSELVADVVEQTGLLSPADVTLARSAAKTSSFAQALVDEGLAAPERVANALSARFAMPVVDLVDIGVSADAAQEIPLHVLERLVAIPYAIEGGVLRVAIADPQNVNAIDELKLATRLPIELGVSSKEDILHEVKRLARAAEAFGARAMLEAEEEELAAEEDDEAGDDLEAEDGISDAPLVRLVNSIIFQAAEEGASDVHFEPQADSLVVRFRTDGVMHEVQRVPKRMTAGVITRLKVLAKLDIAERRKPQDGRISLSAAAAGRLLDIRVATLPTVDGEKIAMRLLDKSKMRRRSRSSASRRGMRNTLSGIINKPGGALLVTGPTGSGKSTTLYSALTEIHRPEINIVTVEDPVEYRLPGVSQIQINIKAGLTFASALRSILRADPDVVMVGEIRDAETAKISIEAALTGHFVLSSLAYERRARRAHAPERDGRRALPDRLGSLRGPRSASRAEALPALLRDVQPLDRRAAPQPGLAGGRGRLGRRRLLPQARMPAVRPQRLSRPDRRLPAARDDRGPRIACRVPREPRTSSEPPSKAGCARSGTTGSRRSRPASHRSRS